MEIAKIKKLDDFLVAVDMEKTFHSLDHNFLISILEKFCFSKNFTWWVNILLRDQESYVINNGTTTKYFLLEGGTFQGDPISAFLFILALKILFVPTKLKPEIEGLTICNYKYLYFAYADDTTFFLQDIISIKHMVDTFFHTVPNWNCGYWSP